MKDMNINLQESEKLQEVRTQEFHTQISIHLIFDKGQKNVQ